MTGVMEVTMARLVALRDDHHRIIIEMSMRISCSSYSTMALSQVAIFGVGFESIMAHITTAIAQSCRRDCIIHSGQVDVFLLLLLMNDKLLLSLTS